MAQQAAYRAPGPIAVSNAPPGTFAPGTKVQVGNHRVTIEKYLSEGGFAHVYLVRVPKSDSNTPETAVLKRVACADKPPSSSRAATRSSCSWSFARAAASLTL